MSEVREAALAFNYSDRFSTLMLWWKAAMLLPIWGYAALPFIGSFGSLFGDAAGAVIFVGVITGGLLYFFEDVLKRKVRIEHGFIVHGYRSRKMSTLLSIGTVYKRNEVLPKKITLTFERGKSMDFRLSRISLPDYQKFLRLVETNYPQCKVDPVLQTLISCKKVARKVLVDDSDKFIIEYKSERAFINMWRAFLDTAYPWLRIGPVFVVFISSAMYTAAIGGMLGSGVNWARRNGMSAMANQLSSMCSSFFNTLGQAFFNAGTNFANSINHPVIGAASLAVLVYFLGVYTSRLVFQPNRLVVDKDALTLAMSLFGNDFICHKLYWQLVSSVGLQRTVDGKAKIVFRMTSGVSFDFDFSSIIENDRPRLINALERLAPGCTIDSDLTEAMMPHHDRSYTELWLQSLSASPERSSLQALAPGQKLENDRYVVVRRVGVGGQGTAYLCRDVLEKCDVVLKETVIPVFADRAVKEQALRRFDQEAKILQSLENEHIVALRDHFFEDHRGYLVLEHIPGETLRQLVKSKGVVSQEQAMDLARQMCLILAYLHERDIIHRDFTPDNLILTADGRLKLIDFNVAQSMQVGTTGTIAGKHAYLPPEQFRGKATCQSDIYALGATLFFLLKGEDPEPISQSILSESAVVVNSSLERVVADCTALDCSKRCASVQVVQDELFGNSETSILKLGAADSAPVVGVADNGEKEMIRLKGDSRNG
ncbi:MAG TPA: serine/threonine-protein kinase [Planktothrix sp.]|jgi:tRNA A-37 threonylcarbamoyl transferase component Bud32